MKYLFIFSTVFLTTINVHAAESVSKTVCTIEMQYKLEHIIPKVSSWDEMYKMYLAFNCCDDGWMAESFSDKVTQLLVSQWDSLSTCYKYTQSNLSFREFLLNHIDPTCDIDLLKSIESNSRLKCDKGMSAFCEEIRQRASQSIKLIEIMP